MGSIITILTTLVVLINPLGAMSAFLSLTSNQSITERKLTAKHAAIAVAMVILISGLIGKYLLDFLGISIGAFRLSGGFLILLIAIALMNAKPIPTKTSEVEQEEASSRSNIAVVPLALPIMAGPGTISSMIIWTEEINHIWQMLTYPLLVGVAMGLICYMVLITAIPMSRFLGQTGINVINRVMGMILAAIAVEIMVKGFHELFPYV